MKNVFSYPIAAAILFAPFGPALADSATDAILLRMEAKIDALVKENTKLQSKLNRIEETRAARPAPGNRAVAETAPPQPPKTVYAAAYSPSATNAMALAPAYNWTGCYIGLQGGGGTHSTNYISNGGFGGVGAIGGVQGGCNYQRGQFVVGLEAEFWGSTTKDFYEDDYTGGYYRESSRNPWAGAFSIRSGIAIDRALIFGKLGVALGRFEYRNEDNNPDSWGGGKATYTGVLLGAGFEYGLTDHWTAKFEYNYINYGTKLVDFTYDTNVYSPYSYTVKEVQQFVKFGANYKF